MGMLGSGFPIENISILRVLKEKNVPILIFKQRVPKKGVESEYDLHFGHTWAKIIRKVFFKF